jgi:hypothetical protein
VVAFASPESTCESNESFGPCSPRKPERARFSREWYEGPGLGNPLPDEEMLTFESDDASAVSLALADYVRQLPWQTEYARAEAATFGDPSGFTAEMKAARYSRSCEEAFDHWFVFERAMDGSGLTPADHFERERGSSLSAGQRAYLNAMRQSALRPYQVLAGDDRFDPVTLRDLESEDLLPLPTRGRTPGMRGTGMAFIRLSVAPDGGIKVNEALAFTADDMRHLQFTLKMLHHELNRAGKDVSGDALFKFATPYVLRAWINSFRPTAKRAGGKRIAQLKIVLAGIRPHIWRRLLVPERITLASLASVLERTMGWESYHLHQFEIDGVDYGPTDLEEPLPVHEERDRRLSDFALKKAGRFYFDYDFGDGWEHRITVEKLLEPEPGIGYPLCIDGARACPPEDVGGVGGYREFLKALRNPRHPEHGDLKRWSQRRGRAFDPERFDPAEVNKGLTRRRVIVPHS